MSLVGRKYTQANSGYRYGFNGKENDKEVNGEGNSYDFGDRVYDPRVGRLLSVDQKSAMYPSHSPYCYAVGNPIFFIDPDGNSVEPYNIVVTKEKGTNKFKVTGDITIKIQVLNLSAKANNDLYIHDYVNRVKNGLTDILNMPATVTQNNDVDMQIGGKGTASNKLIKTGKVRETEWTYAFNVNVQIEVIDSKDKIRQDAHVLAIVDSYDERPSSDIEGNPILKPIGLSNGDRVATVGVKEIAGFKFNNQLHTALHEIAHSLGVSHFWNKVPGDRGVPNLMDYKLRNNKLDAKQLALEVWFSNLLSPEQLHKKLNDKKTTWSQEKEKFKTSSKEKLNKLIINGGVNTTN
jgi:RHS repeat-associated protein